MLPIVLWLTLISCALSSELVFDHLRGVPFNRRPFYDPEKAFTCLNGQKTISFQYVNDDYCDCDDGSDEPGTSACSENGSFYCRNLGHAELHLPSSRVNDFICDCCDGSDEYAGYVQCPNTCKELGAKAREQAEKQAAVAREGFQKRQQLIQSGSKAKEERKKSLDEYLKQKADLEPQKIALETKKTEAETLESTAKEEHRSKWENEKRLKQEERERRKAAAAFSALDVNKDNKVSAEEIIPRLDFDTDNDGTVTSDEALEWLGHQPETDLERFIAEIWTRIKDVYKPSEAELQAAETTTPSPDSTASSTESTPEEEVSEDDIDDFDAEKYMQKGETPEKHEEEDEEMPEYSEDTKRLIDEADKAREQFNEVDKKFREVEDQIRKIEDLTKMDLGPNNEFADMVGKCFEYSEYQYTYKLCMFERCSQRNKDGGSETTLGNWGHWSGQGPSSVYSKQKYENGNSCWNGPERSTVVRMICGVENKLIAASEPARCEYQFDFETPTVCDQPDPHPTHSEL